MDWITFENVDWEELGNETVNTLAMLGFSSLFAVVIGLPIGVLLFLTSRGQILQHRAFYSIVSTIVNILRSVPFIILMILLIPFTKLLMGTAMDVPGAIPPLVIGAAPFFARMVEISLREVDRGVIEAAQSMGATNWQVIWKVLLPEAKPGLIAGVTMTTVALVSYTAMAGAVGAGGLGDLAIRYGYQRYQTDVAVVTVVVLLILVQILQSFGDRLVARFSRK